MAVTMLPSITMSMGPRAGVPFPSTTVALRITRRWGRTPCCTPVVWPDSAMGRSSAARAASDGRRMEWLRGLGAVSYRAHGPGAMPDRGGRGRGRVRRPPARTPPVSRPAPS